MAHIFGNDLSLPHRGAADENYCFYWARPKRKSRHRAVLAILWNMLMDDAACLISPIFGMR